MIPPSSRVTQLLQAWTDGDPQALEDLIPLVHEELLARARLHMVGERSGHTLQTAALVNEAYLRLVDIRHIHFNNRLHFIALASRVMRRILVDAARARQMGKRGGGADHVPLDEARLVADTTHYSVRALDEALTTLSTMDPRRGKVVELRFFGGLTIEETAKVLQVSADTVVRDWKLAKAWLARELDRDMSPQD